jgi:DMSO/TMAO reductase YedYZ molybdopterin-dependent catalytic subunit
LGTSFRSAFFYGQKYAKFAMGKEFTRMKRLIRQAPVLVGIILILVIIAGGLAGCVSTTTVTVSPTTTNTATAAALTIVNGTQTNTLTMADIKAMTPVSGSTGLITSSGTIDFPFELTGVALSDIVKTVGGITSNDAVKISAKDGYSMTLSYNQVMNGTGFPTYDSTTGKEVTPVNNIVVFIAYEQNGQAIGDDIGPLRMCILAPGQITDGQWWVKWVQKIAIIPLQTDWTLNDVGTITKDILKSDFEAGTAPNCHGVTWTDAQGHVWSGEALWLLAAYVTPIDPDNSMGQLNTALWNQGFQVEVIGSNGSMVTYNSADINNNNNIIVANQEDGQPLTGAQWPLALAGSGVDAQHQIGGITGIKVILPTTTTTAKP